MENPFELFKNELSDIKSILLEIKEKPERFKEDIQITSLRQLAQVLDCSLPKAQSVKNSLPPECFFQSGRKFSISKNWLLNEWPKLQANRGK